MTKLNSCVSFGETMFENLIKRLKTSFEFRRSNSLLWVFKYYFWNKWKFELLERIYLRRCPNCNLKMKTIMAPRVYECEHCEKGWVFEEKSCR